jgi:hypothetical protein
VSVQKAQVNVSARNSLGQFTKLVEEAGHKTVEEMVEIGANESRRQAPVGGKHDRRTVPIKQSIFTQMFNRSSGMWGSSARHALYQEKGTRPHEIVSSKFNFFWQNEGRMWIPGLFRDPDIINHPGHDAQPFLEPAFNMVMTRWRQIARKHYPS